MTALRTRRSSSVAKKPDDVTSVAESSLKDNPILGFSDDDEDGVSRGIRTPPSTKIDGSFRSKLTDNYGSDGPRLFGRESEEMEEDFNMLNRTVQISDLDKIDHAALLKKMHDRFKRKVEKWERLAYSFARYSFAMNFTILILQLIQMILHQASNVWMGNSKEIMTIHGLITAATALIAGLQLKLKLSEKAERYRKGAKIYGRLLRISSYYLMMVESGGKVDDVTGLWRDAMRKEEKWVPLVRSYVPL